MKKPKITFFFNQLLTPKLCTGGEIRGQIIASYFQQDKNYQVEVIIPQIAQKSFSKFKKIFIGHQSTEKYINHNSLTSAFIIYLSRTFETIIKLPAIKTDIIYSTGDFFCDIIPAFLKKLFHSKIKFVTCIHHVNDQPFQRKSNFFLANIISYLGQRFSFFLIKEKADLIFVVNKQVKKYLIAKGFKQIIIVSGNGLNIKKIQSTLKQLQNIPTKNHISYFGRISPTKGVFDFPQILTEVIKTYPDVHLDLIGNISPEIKKSLNKKFAKFHCQKNYTFHGFIEDKKKIFEIMLQSKAIIFPSYEEGWGISLFESIMTKRPVIAYNLPIFKEIFKSKLKTVAIGDTSNMAKTCINFMKNFDHQSTQDYINQCYDIVCQYDWKNVFKKELTTINGFMK